MLWDAPMKNHLSHSLCLFMLLVYWLGLFRLQRIENANYTCLSKWNYWLRELKGVYALDPKELFDSPLHQLAFLVSVFASLSTSIPSPLSARQPGDLQTPIPLETQILFPEISFLPYPICAFRTLHIFCLSQLTHWLHPGTLGWSSTVHIPKVLRKCVGRRV